MVALDRPQVTAWLSWLAVLMNIGLNIAWSPAHGALGAAWATLVSYTLCGMGATWLVRDLHWLARVQLGALVAPVTWLITPRRHIAQWQQMFTPVQA
jgi:O-antigen/teichoic acid export membrane protein